MEVFLLGLLWLNQSLENTLRFPNLLDNGQRGNKIINHMPSDEADKIDYEKMEKISQLTYWILKELAEGDKIPNFEK